MQILDIENTKYKVVAKGEDVTIPDCTVVIPNKIGKGSGEAKLYIGNDNNVKLREFYGTNIQIKCIFLKSDLLNYLNHIKPEYKFPKQEYRNKDSMPILWDERFSAVNTLKNEVNFFEFFEKTSLEPPRVYINSKDTLYKMIRELALPNLNHLEILKLQNIETNSIIFYYKLIAENKITEPIEKSSNISRNLKNLFLDPNNYRFIDDNKYIPVDIKESISVKIQQRTRNFIEGKNRAGVKDLLDSFKSNGFLEVDMIQLKDLGENKYLVLEGNRRVTALKILQEDYLNGYEIGKFNVEIFKRVPSFVHKEDADEDSDAKHQIIMGLKHISGNRKWPAINQAKLIYDYLQPHWETNYYKEETKLCESLGITKSKLRTSQRAYHLILQYKDSDYGDQFISDMYYTFAEITKKPVLKSWIGWNEDSYAAENEENIQRLFSWLSENEEEDEDSEDDSLDEIVKIIPPIITKYREIQDLARFINDEQALDVMVETESVAQGLLASGNIEEESYKSSLQGLTNNISELERLRDLISNEDIEKLTKLYKNFSSILPQTSALDIQTDTVSFYFGKAKVNHFNSLFIEKYKIFNNFKIEKLNRINIFAGFNNSGKTTLLEAIYLLTKQNNISSFFEMIRLSNKLEKIDTLYMNDFFTLEDEIKVKGSFNGIQTRVNICKTLDADINKKDDYLASYIITSDIDGEELKNTTHTFKVNPLERYYDKIEVLCKSLFKSPYFYNRQEVVNTHFTNVEVKAMEKIISFISDKIDQNIDAISLTDKNDIQRFLVDSKKFNKSMDITSYGEGLQRIFELALSFAYCKNGVLLIDELETAIHYSLLVDFTKLVQELAVEFNVQVFITTHSKECVDAFVNNAFKNEDISANFLENIGSEIKIKNAQGDRLKYLVDNINLDIRGNSNG